MPSLPRFVVSFAASDPTGGAGLQADLLTLAAAVERASEHPLAAAVVRGAEARKLMLPATTDFRSVTAGGVAARVNGRAVLVGKLKFLVDEGVTTPPALIERATALQTQGKTVLFAAVDGTAAAENFAAIEIDLAIVQMGLRRTFIRPIEVTRQQMSPASRNADIWVLISTPGFKQQNIALWIFAQAICQHTARSARADDDVVDHKFLALSFESFCCYA